MPKKETTNKVKKTISAKSALSTEENLKATSKKRSTKKETPLKETSVKKKKSESLKTLQKPKLTKTPKKKPITKKKTEKSDTKFSSSKKVTLSEAEKLARKAAEFALSKKATDVVLLDVRKISGITDFFLLCTADSDRQVKAIAEEIEKGLKDEGDYPSYVEAKELTWVVMDYFNVIIHIFVKEKRHFYALEKLWGDAPIYHIQEESKKI
ncbi:MAG: ribosome silencing factor [Chloroherpetonaceae bacterium]|nr:ribosome silencing factor [Chloroherpetonaceae bacterium]